jgi:hypothetical protein
MEDLRFVTSLQELIVHAIKSGLAPAEVAALALFAMEELGERESGERPGFAVALGWLEKQRSSWLARLTPGELLHHIQGCNVSPLWAA